MSLVQRSVVGVDIKGYSNRPDRVQRELHERLDRILTDAAKKSELDRDLWVRSNTGDGEVSILPADVNLANLVRQFVAELDVLLTDYNDLVVPEARMHLRVAMHIGTLTLPPSKFGPTGQALIVLARLLDSAPVRSAVNRTPTPNLGLIVSEPLYQSVVLSELNGLRPAQFQQVEIDPPDGKFHGTAYLYVPPSTAVLPAPAPQPELPPVRGFLDRVVRRDPAEPVPETEVPAEVPAEAPAELPPVAQKGPQPALASAVWKLLYVVGMALESGSVERADRLTTQAVLTAANRANHGFLRTEDGTDLPDELFTELDRLWAAASSRAWGFRAQRQHLAGLSLSSRKEFRELCYRLGWSRVENELMPRCDEFVTRADRSTPFYPTLRNPSQESDLAWYSMWQSTVIAAHLRLQAGGW